MNAAMDAFTNHQMLRGANAMRVCASKKAKLRLDERALQARPDMSKAKLQSLIMQGKVKVDATRVTKAGTRVSEHSSISVDDSAEKYVNRASHKLLTALDHFGVLVYNRAALDSGLSTGGFTDVLLQRGASCVYGIDSGRCQVHERIASDTRVHVMERTNLRHLQPHQLNQPVQLATLDLSFISVLKVLPAVHQVLDGTRAYIFCFNLLEEEKKEKKNIETCKI